MVYDKVDYEKVWRNIMSDKLKVGILGGTGMVGQRFIFPTGKIFFPNWRKIA